MLIDRMGESFERHHRQAALWIEGQQYSYRDLETVAAHLRNALSGFSRSRAVGVLTTRSLTAYAGILASALDRRPYVPLNVDYPLERLVKIIDNADLSAVVLSSREVDFGLALQASAKTSPLLLIFDEETHQIDMREMVGTERSKGSRALTEGDPEPPAYIMFTSGTTGEPKGIAISQANLRTYLDAIDHLFDFETSDRFSQFFNLSFDLSVHDLFVAWTKGACLYVPSKAELMDPVGFARQHALTVWFSVPSAVSLAIRFRKLRPNSLPDLRHGLFCGEALSDSVAKAFAAAAPNAELINLYGPTEATIAITYYRLPRLVAGTNDADQAGKDIVPVGHAFPGQETLILKEDLTPVEPGDVGELWLGGTQIASGYTNNPEQTASKFRRFAPPGTASLSWYATGDLVEQHSQVGLVYRGRKDDQIKLHGHRIELTEVEEVLRHAAGTPLAIVTLWPPELAEQPENPSKEVSRKLVAFVATPHPPAAEILANMAATLPPFMVPASINSVADVAFNVNGKLDRKATIERWNSEKIVE